MAKMPVGRWAMCERCGCIYWQWPGKSRPLCERCLTEAILDKMGGKQT